MEKKTSWVILIFLFSALNLSLNGFFGLRLYYTYLNYENPYSYAPIQPHVSLNTGNVEPLADHILLFIVDGFRYDILSQVTLENINRLMREGTEFTSTHAFPFLSVSVPALTTICTGANPWISEVVNNEFNGEVTTDSIFWVAKRQEKVTTVVGTEVFEQLFPEHIDHSLDERILDSEESFTDYLKEQDPTVMVYFMSSSDKEAHKHGVLSTEYAIATEEIDAQIGRVISAYETLGILESTIVVVVGGHGHVDTGGHGGIEPEVLHVPLVFWLPGVVKADLKIDENVYLDSIVPTLSAVMGWEIPSDSSGRVLFDSLVFDERRTSIYKIHLAQIRLIQANITLQNTGLQEVYGNHLEEAYNLLNEAKTAMYEGSQADASLKAEMSEVKSLAISSYIPLGAPLQDTKMLETGKRSQGLLLAALAAGFFALVSVVKTRKKGSWFITDKRLLLTVLLSLVIYPAVFISLLHLNFPQAVRFSSLTAGYSPSYLYSPDYIRYENIHEFTFLIETQSIIAIIIVSFIASTSLHIFISLISKKKLTEALISMTILYTLTNIINLIPVLTYWVNYGGIAWFTTDFGEGLMAGFLMFSNIVYAICSLLTLISGLILVNQGLNRRLRELMK